MCCTWPWTVRRMLCTRGLPEELASIIAWRSFPRAPSANLIATQRRQFLKRGRADTDRIFIPRGLGTSQFICDKPNVFFGKRFRYGVGLDCCNKEVKVGARVSACSVCKLTVCERCWHRLSDQRCVCARGFCAGDGLAEPYDWHPRMLDYWRSAGSWTWSDYSTGADSD